jgi:maleate isomerase
VDVLAFASTSSGYILGYDEESALVKRLRERWKVPVCATSLSAVSALRSRDVERISLVHPPWFGASLNELGAEYFRSQGFEVVDARLADLPDDPGQVEPAIVVEWVAQHLCDRAQAVFIGGNGFRAARAVHDLECRTGRLVLEANQVLLWSVLENAGAPVAVRGFGMLFDDRQPDGTKMEER